jgi:hypothetical protein
MKLPQAGGCQCGAFRYELSAEPSLVYTCHCTECQHATSSAFSMALVVEGEAFTPARRHTPRHILVAPVSAFLAS